MAVVGAGCEGMYSTEAQETGRTEDGRRRRREQV
jgi:hypothetical protein